MMRQVWMMQQTWMTRQTWMMRVGLVLVLALTLNACGRKEVPLVMTGEAIAIPQIDDLQTKVIGNVLRMDFVLKGDAQGVGYEIDRTQLDPYCHCPGMWRRFFEQPALKRQANQAAYRIINLKTDKIEFLFRIRAVDVSGNFGPWSKMIHARAIDLSK